MNSAAPTALSVAVPAPSRSKIRILMLGALALAIAYGFCRTLAPYFQSVGAILATADWRMLAVVGVSCVAYRLANAGVWGWALAALGWPLSTAKGARMWLLSEACRWLPGSLWSFGSRVALGVRGGIPASVVGAGMALELICTLGAWLLFGLGGAFLADMPIPISWDPKIALFAITLLAAGTILALYHPARRRVIAKIEAVANRVRILACFRPQWRMAFGVFSAYSALSAFNGITCWLVIRAVCPNSDVSISAVIAANSLAWLAGYFALFAPAGIGVREGAFVLLLSPLVPWETCAVAATFWRFAQIISELICLGLAAAIPLESTNVDQLEQGL
jgi:glycosyltransferase 2 family protein